MVFKKKKMEYFLFLKKKQKKKLRQSSKKIRWNHRNFLNQNVNKSLRVYGSELTIKIFLNSLKSNFYNIRILVVKTQR